MVDTGLHHKRWTRQQAIDYLIKNTPNAEDDCVEAINRYIVSPSQATAYKIGMLKILELRAKAKKELGDEVRYPPIPRRRPNEWPGAARYPGGTGRSLDQERSKGAEPVPPAVAEPASGQTGGPSGRAFVITRSRNRDRQPCRRQRRSGIRPRRVVQTSPAIR